MSVKMYSALAAAVAQPPRLLQVPESKCPAGRTKDGVLRIENVRCTAGSYC